MIVHTGAARLTITFDDGSVWSWKGADLGGGPYWLSGADFPGSCYDETTDRRFDSMFGTTYYGRRTEPIRYNDLAPLTEGERAGMATIIKRATQSTDGGTDG